MHHMRQENLPHLGSSHQFIGAEQGDTAISMFLFEGKPGSEPGPHRHPYDEIQFIREGRGVWTVDGKAFEGKASDIFVIKAGEIHSFRAVGDSPLIQLDVHLSPRFIQENLQPRLNRHPSRPGSKTWRNRISTIAFLKFEINFRMARDPAEIVLHSVTNRYLSAKQLGG